MNKQLRLRLSLNNNALDGVWDQLPAQRQKEIHDHYARLIASAAQVESRQRNTENTHDQDD